MLIAFGKIAKCTLLRLEPIVKYERDFSLEYLPKAGDHLPGERDVFICLCVDSRDIVTQLDLENMCTKTVSYAS